YVYSDEPVRLDVSGSGRSIARLATHGKHVECLLAKSHEHDPPVAASGQASKLSADYVLQHILVERQVSHDLLQLAVLLLELTQSLHLRRHQPAVLLAPIVIGRLVLERLSEERTSIFATPTTLHRDDTRTDQGLVGDE